MLKYYLVLYKLSIDLNRKKNPPKKTNASNYILLTTRKKENGVVAAVAVAIYSLIKSSWRSLIQLEIVCKETLCYIYRKKWTTMTFILLLLLIVTSEQRRIGQKNVTRTKFENDKTIIETIKKLDDQINTKLIGNYKNKEKIIGKTIDEQQQEFSEAIDFGLKSMRELLDVKEPEWYHMGLYLDKSHPASFVANFGAPNKKALELSHLGYAAIEATKKISETNLYRQNILEARLVGGPECPLTGSPKCIPAARRYRTADGTCNNWKKPWRGAALLPLRRFLPPSYEDGVGEPRRGLPSARDVSSQVHRDRDVELTSVTLMFMQWGQFIDHDVTATVKSRGFNGTIPRCCQNGGEDLLPEDLMHPSCFPIIVPPTDWFFSQFGIGCMEFIRSAPTTRFNCDLGHREQMNQVTAYLDASTIYGSDVATSDSMRTFRHGKLHHDTSDICRSGAITGDCLQSGDGRFSEQPGLIAIHTLFLKYHNQLADVLSQLNRHWSDEKIYQETRRIIGAVIQHITYREYLPIVVGEEVMELFELKVLKKGYWDGYDERVDAGIANGFSTAAFRFGHSLVQNSYVRYDHLHRPMFNNVTLHREQDNPSNIFSTGSLDRLLLGLCNQPSQRRDEYIATELTNHLFQSPSIPFGMDLAAINIQRGRDHGLPPYTAWRQPCGLAPITTWHDLHKIMQSSTVDRLQRLYRHPNDIDLFTGGLAEKPVRGGTVGPTFACIIAQQFLNLRKGDRFWYENGGMASSFTPAQLQQLRKMTLAHVMCQTLRGVETIQPFVFLAADNGRNGRVECDEMGGLDLTAWIERESFNEIDSKLIFSREARKKKRKIKITTTSTTTTKRPKRDNKLKIPITKVTTSTVPIQKQTYVAIGNNYDMPQRPTFDTYYNNYYRPTSDKNDMTYLFGVVETTTTPPPTPIEVNIKIQYYPQSTTTKKPKTNKNKIKRPNPPQIQYEPVQTLTTRRPTLPTNFYDVANSGGALYSNDFNVYNNKPTKTPTNRPYIYNKPTNYNYIYTKKRPNNEDLYSQLYYRPNFDSYNDRETNYGHVEKITTDQIDDKLDFGQEFVKISSVSGQQFLADGPTNIHLHISQREGDDLVISDENETRFVDLHVIPDENRWLIFNETKITDDIQIGFDLPDLNRNVSCTDELPRPIFDINNTTTTDKPTTT